MPMNPSNKEIPNQVRNDKLYVIASDTKGGARQSRSGFCGLLRRSFITPRNDGRSFAFTLAEVLITLVIIGVIAALTIPNLMQKYQEEALKTAYKKTLTLLNNAYRITNAQNGPFECQRMANGQTKTQDCKALFDSLFLNTLKPIKVCTNKAIQNGCLPDGGYKSAPVAAQESGMFETQEDSNAHYNTCNLVSKNFLENSARAVILNDGQIVLFVNNHYAMFIDINGKKGPNKWGYDVFEFDIMQWYKPEPTITYGQTNCVTKEKGGKTPKEMYNSVILNK